jgi:hypothetical protein
MGRGARMHVNGIKIKKNIQVHRRFYYADRNQRLAMHRKNPILTWTSNQSFYGKSVGRHASRRSWRGFGEDTVIIRLSVQVAVTPNFFDVLKKTR